MSSNSVTVNIHMHDGAPSPQVTNLSTQVTPRGTPARPLVAIEFSQHPADVAVLVSSVEQVDRLAAALAVARELLTGSAS